MKNFLFLFFCLGLQFVSGCGSNNGSYEEDQDLREMLKIPSHLPLPAIPTFNQPSREKILLGKHLFHDKRLSVNQTQSCASCHDQTQAFTDGQVTSLGATGQPHFRNSQGLANVSYLSTLTWSNNTFLWLEDQINVPITNDNPIELGLNDGNREAILQRFRDDTLYQNLFTSAFPEDPEVNLNKIVFALASFVRGIISGSSAYDRFLQGDEAALNSEAREGLRLFNSEKFECFHCHNGVNLTISHKDTTNAENTQFSFFNNGLYNVDGTGSYPKKDQGLYDLTLNPQHRGLFRPPSLRNVELTGPYMHDGSIATLEEVIQHYARGGRLISSGPNAGDGKNSPLKSGLIRGFSASDAEIRAVIAFLRTLTDWEFINDPDYQDPFTSSPPPTIEDN
jgi:cytochrome c peroxidase